MNTQKSITLEEWVEGVNKESAFSSKNLRRLLKIIGFIVGAIALCALAIGLFIELS